MTAFDTPAHSSSALRYQVISFGDSLSDVGTYAPAAARFGGGRFTTNPGEVWTQILAQAYGDTLIAAYTGKFKTPLTRNPLGFGYAQGGSRIEHPVPFSGNTALYSNAHENHQTDATPQQALRNAHKNIRQRKSGKENTLGLMNMSIAAQIESHLENNLRFTPSQLVLINGGSNDIMANAVAAAIGEIGFAEAIRSVQTAASQYAGLIQKLYAHGAENLIMTNMPDLGHTPIGMTDIETSTVLTQLSLLFNTTTLKCLETQLPAEHSVVFIDTFSYLNQVLDAYKEYGFSVSNTGIACKMEALPAYYQSTLFASPKIYVEPNADQTYMFADGAHPSTRMHALFAQHIQTQFEASLAKRVRIQENAAVAA